MAKGSKIVAERVRSRRKSSPRFTRRESSSKGASGRAACRWRSRYEEEGGWQLGFMGRQLKTIMQPSSFKVDVT